MELNLVITVPNDLPISDIGMVFTLATADLIKHIAREGMPEVDEQVCLDKHVEFYRSE